MSSTLSNQQRFILRQTKNVSHEHAKFEKSRFCPKGRQDPRNAGECFAPKAVTLSMNPSSGDKKVPLTWNQWQLAYPRFAIEAAACGMIPFAASMGHMVGSLCMLLRGLLCAVGSGELPAHCRDCLCGRKSPAMAGDPLRRGRIARGLCPFNCPF